MSLDVLFSPCVYVYSKSKLISLCIKDGTIRVLFTPKKKVLPYMWGFPEVAIILPHFPTLLLMNFHMLPFTFSIYLEKQKLSKKEKNMLTQTPKGKLIRLNDMDLESIWICYTFYIIFYY